MMHYIFICADVIVGRTGGASLWHNNSIKYTTEVILKG
jgi:hypothetical protein